MPDVADRLLAVQAQDPRGARLAVRARTRGLVASAVDRELSDTRSVVVSWYNRGTLHLVRAEDHAWLLALTGPPQVTGNDRRLGQEGLSDAEADRGVDLVLQALASCGPTSRAVLREHLVARGVRVGGQAFVHTLMRASLRGHVVRGPVVDGEQAFVLARDWLGAAPPVDRDVALVELARRYLVGHGPASDRDLARWAGISLGDARRGIRGVRPTVVEDPDGLVHLPGLHRAPTRPPPPRLLGAFDPLLLGWTSRTDVLGDRAGVVTSNGVFRPFLLVEGRAAGLWSLRAGGVELRPFDPLDPAVRTALEAEAADVRRFLAG